MANKANKWASDGEPLSCVNSAIANYLKDGSEITGVIEEIRNSGVDGQHLRSIFQIWKGFGNLDYWDILFDECKKKGLC